MFEINYSQLIQCEILDKLVTYILLNVYAFVTKIYFQSKTDVYMNVKVVPAMINDIEIKMRTMLKNKSTLAKTCSCWIFGAKAKSAEKARRKNMTTIPMSEMIPVLKTQYPDSQCSTESRQLVQECHRLVQFSILTKVLVLSINSE